MYVYYTRKPKKPVAGERKRLTMEEDWPRERKQDIALLLSQKSSREGRPSLRAANCLLPETTFG
jgi:hypothetical protein